MLPQTKTLSNLLSATKGMLGDGMTWLIQAADIRGVLKSFLNIPEMARTYFIFIGGSTFPTQQIGKIPDEQLEENLKQFEKQFGLKPAVTATLQERAIAVEAQWSITGSLGIKYLQKILNDSGVPVFLRENIPAIDYSADFANITYGGVTYNETFEPYYDNKIKYGSGKTYGSFRYGEAVPPYNDYMQYSRNGATAFLLGNGFLTTQEGNVSDIANIPSSLPQWQAVVLVEGEIFGSNATLTAAQYSLFLDLFLTYKRADTVGLCRITIT